MNDDLTKFCFDISISLSFSLYSQFFLINSTIMAESGMFDRLVHFFVINEGKYYSHDISMILRPLNFQKRKNKININKAGRKKSKQ